MKNKVQRYEPGDIYARMNRSDDGDYVEYEDYQKLESDFRAVANKLIETLAELAESNKAIKMYCSRTLKAEERENKAKAELAAMKKDARMLAEYIDDENTSQVSDHALNADALREAALRVLKATKEKP